MSEQTKHDGGPASPSQDLPRLVVSLTNQFDAWLVGSAADPKSTNPRDYDVIVPMYEWHKAVHLLPPDATMNSFGGWKCISDGKEVDVWPGDLGWLLQHPKARWALHPRTGIRLQVHREVDNQDRQAEHDKVVEEINKLTEKLLDSGPSPEKRFRKKKTTSSDVDCDFYYFSPNGKWRYYGEGRFPRPTDGGWHRVTHDTVYQENKGMPGILGNGKTYILLVIPRENCQVKTAYPRLIFPEA